MSDTSGATAIAIERRDSAIIARPQMKMMDDDALKTLIKLIDASAGAEPAISLVVLDLSRVAILPSLALGLLVQLSSKCKARQQKLVLAAVQPQLRQVFSITRLNRVFDFAATVDAAVG